MLTVTFGASGLASVFGSAFGSSLVAARTVFFGASVFGVSLGCISSQTFYA